MLEQIESILSCGHAGDGNIHCTLLKEDRTDDEWDKLKNVVLDEIYKVTYELGGSLSGEHGIGAKRVKYKKKYVNDMNISIIRSIKLALDPNLILNPDKVADFTYSA